MTPPDLERFATAAETTTTADPGTSGTSLAVQSRSAFPAAAPFNILVQNAENDKTNREIMRVTGGAGTGAGSFTVTRGREGTTGVVHPVGSYVAQVLTAAAIRRWIPEYIWLPRHNDMLLGSGDPNYFISNSTLAAGVLHLVKLPVPEDMTLVNACALIAVASSAENANTFLGVYNKAGTLLGKTAESSAAFRSVGAKEIALVAESGQSLLVPGGPDEFVMWAFIQGTAGTTPLQIPRSSGVGSAVSFGLSAAQVYRSGTSGSGQTALPASVTLTTLTPASVLYFCGFS